VGEGVSAVQLIVGLGNPGSEYANTRHNAGAWLVETLSKQYRLTFKTESKFNARITQWTYGGKDFKLLIPNTYMNHSGQPVGAYAHYYQIPPEDIIVAHDELDLPPGTARFKTGGGHAGHNGLRDIIHHLHSREFHRLRIGIGHPGSKEEVSNYVLNKPSKAEEKLMRLAIDDAIRVLPKIMMGDWQAAVNQLHSTTN
jgi:PTH1 family peptidyl-tRNA hydrolase